MSNVPSLDIYFRSCTRVYAVHGGARVVDASKSEIVLTCLRSLLASVHHYRRLLPEAVVRLWVVDDHSDSESVRRIQTLLSRIDLPTAFVAMKTTGNSASLKANYALARASFGEAIYFVEDDYLHCETAIAEMMDGFQRFSPRLGRAPILFPCDYPDRYDDPYPSYVLVGAKRHWRSTRHTTGTFWVPRSVFVAYAERYDRFSDYGVDPEVTEDSSINPIYAEVPCFSPMPSLTTHLAYAESLSPFVDWRECWARNSQEERAQ